MSKFFDDLMTGLNEAVEVERGNLETRKTVYEIQPVKSWNDAGFICRLYGRFYQNS